MSEIEETNGATQEQTPIISSEMLPSEKVLEEEAEERRAEEERKKNREPPIVFKEIDVSDLVIFVGVDDKLGHMVFKNDEILGNS
jgi:hypothetical protein